MANLSAAEQMGLQRLGLVDHVRHSTNWVPNFTAAVDRLRGHTDIDIICGVEARLLNTSGELDLPPDLSGVDRIYIADHRLPIGLRALTPKEVRALRRRMPIPDRVLIAGLVDACINAMHTCPLPAVLAHWGSILPKIRIPPSAVPDDSLARLARAAQQTGTWIEVDERWRAPTVRIAQRLRALGAKIVFSSDAHRPQHIGKYTWATQLHQAAI